jgi:O-antigen ligase
VIYSTIINRVHRILFFIFVFFLPVNLGKHFDFVWSYVNGRLVDYLVPTVYATDLILVLILFFWVLSLTTSASSGYRNKLVLLLNRRGIHFLLLFVISLFFSSVVAANINIAIFLYIKIILYIGLFFYTATVFSLDGDLGKIAKIFSVSVILLSFLAIAQWEKQSSVFNNYLFFGEQPYSYSTYGVVKENFLGLTKIPPYATFRHPNVFAGFLITGIAITAALLPHWLALVAIILGVLSLFYTFSFSAWLVLLVSSLYLIFVRPTRYRKAVTALFAGSVVLFVVVMSFLPLYGLPESIAGHPSVYRRVGLIEQTWDVVKASPLYGVGLGNFYYHSRDFMFQQPVHNLFLMMLSETGVISFILFSLFLLLSFKTAFKFPLFLLLLGQMLLLSSFDHYFYTIHQTQMLFWLVLGILYAYELREELN